jgi:hypothetical protein
MKFIFEVRMKPGYTVDEYADAWIRASKIIQRTPGARGTYLHRKIGDPTTRWRLRPVIGEFNEPQWSVLPEQADSDGS